MIDHNQGYMTCSFTMKDGTIFKERYECTMPKLVVGNLVIGERFIEPSGSVTMTNIDTGDTCEMVYKSRGTWSTAEKDKNAVSAVVKNKKGEIRFTLDGRYTTEIIGTDVENQSTWQL